MFVTLFLEICTINHYLPVTLCLLQLADGVTPSNVAVPVMMGRELQVPLAAGKICKFDFADLCGRPLAAADYLALTDRFHTMVLSGVR